jgi:hypothetical protein
MVEIDRRFRGAYSPPPIGLNGAAIQRVDMTVIAVTTKYLMHINLWDMARVEKLTVAQLLKKCFRL